MDSAIAPLQEIARAKINLSLRVLGRLPNGYHAIESLIVFADIGDELGFTPGPEATVETTGPFAAEIDGENLVSRACTAVAAAHPSVRLGRFAIEKRLPVAAGLGGGSADAAAALRLIRRHNPEIAERIDWPAIAASIGADVTVCLESCPAQAWGMGERIRTMHDLPRLHAVLVNAREPVPADKTRQVFAALRASPIPHVVEEPGAPGPNLLDWLQVHGNDLESAARSLFPTMTEVAAALQRQGGSRLVRMSGAGPTWFAIYDDQASARTAAAALAADHPSWWISQACLN